MFHLFSHSILLPHRGRTPSPLQTRRIRRTAFRVAFLAAAWLPAVASALEVATLHPLMGDLARQIGQDRVTVIELIGPEDNPHQFDPSPRTFEAAAGAPLILASGKGLESHYLPKLADGLQPNQEIFQVGRGVHSLVAADGNLAACCAHHRHTGIVDPHWWHDPDNMRRAAYQLAEKMGEV
ncbi:MAG: metal ABC transporter substrate-binding protein, partial [Puniceicoccales bacterium]